MVDYGVDYAGDYGGDYGHCKIVETVGVLTHLSDQSNDTLLIGSYEYFRQDLRDGQTNCVNTYPPLT